jgi:hypothetical protein
MMRSFCYSAFLLRGSQLSRANSWADAELLSIDMLAVSAIGLVAAANLVEVAGSRGYCQAFVANVATSQVARLSSVARNRVSLKSA